MKKYKLIYLLSAILIIGFFANSLLSFFASQSSIHRAVVDYELPLSADKIYAEMQNELIQPVTASKMMATDGFLRDWVIAGERDEAKIIRYLHEIQVSNKTFVSYFVSNKTHKYYYSDGKTRTVSETDPQDAWYPRFRASGQDYVLNLDTDKATPNVYVIYVDHKMVDDSGNFIGLAGSGIALSYLTGMIESYQARYKHNIYFVDTNGVIMLSDNKTKHIGDNIKRIFGDKTYKHIMLQEAQSGQASHNDDYAYQHNNTNILLNMRYIPELKWYLVVEKDEADILELNENRKALLVNLALSVFITTIALLLAWSAIKRYQTQIEQLATTDSLTGLPNRAAFDVVIAGMLNDSQRNQKPLSIMLFDLDYFKKINDTYGHNAGDLVLQEVANNLSLHMRKADFFCRWGGEEFLVLLKDCDIANAARIAENFRNSLTQITVHYNTHQIALTSSFGVATLQKDEDIEHLISRADMSLYQAKNLGRNRVAVSKIT